MQRQLVGTMLQPFETMPKQRCKSAVINALKIAVTNRLAEHHFNEALLQKWQAGHLLRLLFTEM